MFQERFGYHCGARIVAVGANYMPFIGLWIFFVNLPQMRTMLRSLKIVDVNMLRIFEKRAITGVTEASNRLLEAIREELIQLKCALRQCNNGIYCRRV